MQEQKRIVVVYTTNEGIKVYKNPVNQSSSKRQKGKLLKEVKLYKPSLSLSDIERQFIDIKVLAEAIEKFRLGTIKEIQVKVYKARSKSTNLPYLIVSVMNELANEYFTVVYPISNKLFDKLDSDDIKVLI